MADVGDAGGSDDFGLVERLEERAFGRNRYELILKRILRLSFDFFRRFSQDLREGLRVRILSLARVLLKALVLDHAIPVFFLRGPGFAGEIGRASCRERV